MDYRSQLVTLAQAFGHYTNRSEARVATMVASRGTFFVQLRNGASCTVDTYLQVKRWFNDNWPDGAPWPDGVDRPGVLPNENDPLAADATTPDVVGAEAAAVGLPSAGVTPPGQEAA